MVRFLVNNSAETDALNAALGISVGAILVGLLMGAAYYVFMSLALARIFQKLGEQGWKAWVPVVNTITILELGGYSALWVIAAFVPGLNLVVGVIIILAVNGINLRLGKGGGYTALYIFLSPVWAGLLGFGPAQTGAGPGAPSRFEPAGAVASADYLAAYGRVGPPPASPATVAAIDVPPAIDGPPAPPAAVAAPPASVGGLSPEPFWVPAPPLGQPAAAAVPLPQPVAPEAHDDADEVDFWAPPAAVAAPKPPQPHRAAPPVLPVVPVQPVFDSADDEGDIEATVISTRRAKPWLIETVNGLQISLTRPVVLIGRNPARSAEHPDAQLVAVTDAGKTVSKTHARLELADGLWTITDLHSTNGVVLIDERGDERELPAGTDSLLTERFLLGELPTRIFLER